MKKLTLLIVSAVWTSVVSGYSGNKTLEITVPKTNNIVIFTTEASVDYEGYAGNKILVLNEEDDGALSYEKTQGSNNETRIKIKGTYHRLKIKVPNKLYLLTVEANSFREKANLSIKKYTGRLIVHALMDSINLSGLTAPFYVHSDRGEITLKDINWQQNASWNFESPSPQFSFPYMISSKKSNIVLFLKNAVKASFKLNAIKGSVHSNVKKQKEMMNGGGVAIYAQSDSGDIFLKHEK